MLFRSEAEIVGGLGAPEAEVVHRVVLVTRDRRIVREGHQNNFSDEKLNLAELGRRTRLSRARLRRLKANGFKDKPHGLTGKCNRPTVLTGYESVLDDFLRKGIRNSSVCLATLREMGYAGGQTTVRDYLRNHQNLMRKRNLVG